MAFNDRKRVLFVCSKNKWRSPTGEAVFRSYAELSVRSAGISKSARKRLSASDIQWADLILVMEDKHKSRIKSEFRALMAHKAIHVLDIPDEYPFMDPELVEIIKMKSDQLIWGD